jgi:hypothetical protein
MHQSGATSTPHYGAFFVFAIANSYLHKKQRAAQQRKRKSIDRLSKPATGLILYSHIDIAMQQFVSPHGKTRNKRSSSSTAF